MFFMENSTPAVPIWEGFSGHSESKMGVEKDQNQDYCGVDAPATRA